MQTSIVASINGTAPDIVWVGLGTPMEERWMHEHCDRLNASVILGVGAAFDFHCRYQKTGPEWMREDGLECLFRCCRNHGALAPVLPLGSQFIFYVLLELAGIRKE